MSELFPTFSQDQLREAVFQLCWKQHGGSGLGWTRAEALDLEMGDLKWFLDRIADQRSREARAIEQASKGR